MARIRSHNTAPERIVRSLVHGMGYRYRLHVATLPGRPDLVFASRRKVIFVHGCFWHRHTCKRGALPSSNVDFWEHKLEGNRARDRRSARALRQAGWQVLVIWQCQTRDTVRLTGRLERFLSGTRLRTR